MFQRLGGTAFPFRHSFVPEVLQIFNTHLARKETARRKIAETAEECRAANQLGIQLGWIRESIEHFALLRIDAVNEALVESRLAEMVDECQTSPHRCLAQGLIDHHEVHEFRNTGIACAAGSFVPGNDQVRQQHNRGVFVAREKLRLERRAALRRLTPCGLNLDLRGFRFGGRPRNRGGQGRGCEELQRFSTRDSFHIN